MDEHCLGLHPILRRVWVLEGEYCIGSEKRVLLVIDQAGSHTSNDLDFPSGIDL